MALNMTESQLVGRRVVSQDGFVLGDLASFVVDTGTWRVVDLSIALRRRALEPLGLRKPVIGSQTIRLSADEIAGVSDAIVLRRRMEDLRFLAAEQKPDATTAPPTASEGEPRVRGGIIQPPDEPPAAGR
jgi:sporulation protein YlmC with PRC-barrel domain